MASSFSRQDHLSKYMSGEVHLYSGAYSRTKQVSIVMERERTRGLPDIGKQHTVPNRQLLSFHVESDGIANGEVRFGIGVTPLSSASQPKRGGVGCSLDESTPASGQSRQSRIASLTAPVWVSWSSTAEQFPLTLPHGLIT